MKVEVPNALTINRVGHGLFPVSARMERKGGVTIAHLCPIQLCSLSELITGFAQEFALLFGVAHSDSVQDESGSWGQAPVRDSLPDQVTPLAEDGDELVLRTKDLGPIFRELYVYDAHILDLPSPDVDLADLWCRGLSHDFNSGPLLPACPQSQVYVDSHDDCYYYLESRGDTLPLSAIGVLLAYVAGTAVMLSSGSTCDIPVPSQELVAEVLGAPAAFCADQGRVRVEEKLIRIPFARVPWRGGDPVAHPTHVLVLERDRGEWRIEAVGRPDGASQPQLSTTVEPGRRAATWDPVVAVLLGIGVFAFATLFAGTVTGIVAVSVWVVLAGMKIARRGNGKAH